MILMGGRDRNGKVLKTVVTCDVNKRSGGFSLYGIISMVCKDRLMVTGGYDYERCVISDAIYEILLTPSYTTRLLVSMPQPRRFHGAELLDDKILIVGGTTSNKNEDKGDSVWMYDVKFNVCKERKCM